MSASNKILQAAAGNAAGESVYVEDVFSTYLYEGTSATGNTVNNGIDLDGEGGMVWLKSRGDAQSHGIFDTERGAGKLLSSNTTSAELSYTDISAFNSNGFTLGYYSGWFNSSSYDQCSWTFRKQAGFFDVVTYTGDGTDGRQIAHNLNSTIGFLIIKRRDSSGYYFYGYHRSLGAGSHITLGSNGAANTSSSLFKSSGTYNDSVFTVSDYAGLNASGGTYVAYLFAHDDQSFGDDSDESIIKCGSYTGSSTLPYTVDVGFEPQWLMIKRTDSGSADDWMVVDVMRGQAHGSDLHILEPNNSNAENETTWHCAPTANGFQVNTNVGQFNGNGATYIYVAIRRPMKTPEAGTDVYAADTLGGTAPNPPGYNGILTDLAWVRQYNGSDDWEVGSRITQGRRLKLDETDAEANGSDQMFDYQDGYNNSSATYTKIGYLFKRAAGFLDIVAYTGDGNTAPTGQTIPHNLGVTPEMIIIKNRNSTQKWMVHSTGVTTFDVSGVTYGNSVTLSDTTAVDGTGFINLSGTDANNFKTGYLSNNNTSSNTYIAYLFATVAGVSKVGSYTGTGSDINVDCGFSAGARWVMIKRTDSTGDWYIVSTKRGFGKYLRVVNDAAEVSTAILNTYSSGFQVDAAAGSELNASGGTYIFLAIA
jgi:hypothetical protein